MSAPGGVPGGDPPDGYCCGRYASFWNAFLLVNVLVISKNVKIEFKENSRKLS